MECMKISYNMSVLCDITIYSLYPQWSYYIYVCACIYTIAITSYLLNQNNYVDILNLIICSFLDKEEFYYKKEKRPYNKIALYNQKDVS